MDVSADGGNDFGGQDVVLALVLKKVAYLSFANSYILVSSRVVASARDPAEGVIFTSDNGNILGKQPPGVGVEHNIVVATHHLVEVLESPVHHRIERIPEVRSLVGHIYRLVPGELHVRAGEVNHNIRGNVKGNRSC